MLFFKLITEMKSIMEYNLNQDHKSIDEVKFEFKLVFESWNIQEFIDFKQILNSILMINLYFFLLSMKKKTYIIFAYILKNNN